MDTFAGALQALGALAVAVGLFLVFAPGTALAIVGALALVGGTALEVGRRPKQVVAPVIEHPTTSWIRGPRTGEQSGR